MKKYERHEKTILTQIWRSWWINNNWFLLKVIEVATETLRNNLLFEWTTYEWTKNITK